MFPANWISEAEERLAGRISQTPVTFDSGINAYIKWENRQRTGSFKVRGALNRILQLTPEEMQHGVSAVSTGNHGQAIALAAHEAGVKARVYLPRSTPAEKVAPIKGYGAEVCLVDGSYADAEKSALNAVKEDGSIWISSYNDGVVIAGQGTLGAELSRQVNLDEIEQIALPVGGGGLASGVGAALENDSNRPRLIGIQAETAPSLYGLFHPGELERSVGQKTSLADSLIEEVEKGSITIPLVRHYLEDILMVSEEEIARAMVYAWETWKERLEGSGALTLAAALSGKLGKGKSLLIFSGGNVGADVIADLHGRWTGKTRPATEMR